MKEKLALCRKIHRLEQEIHKLNRQNSLLQSQTNEERPHL